MFAEQAGLSDFFVAAVIVAIVGNAAEHGGAVVVAYRGKITLAAEIALSSAAQVALFLIPAVALLSWLPALEPLALSFRQVEILALGGSVVAAALVLWGGRSSRLRLRASRGLRRRRRRVLRGRRPRGLGAHHRSIGCASTTRPCGSVQPYRRWPKEDR